MSGPGMRTPRSMPKVLDTGHGTTPGAWSGTGRGRGIASVKTSIPQPKLGAYNQQTKERYIPGFNKASDPNVQTPDLRQGKDAPKQVPRALVESFMNGSKHPVSAIMEYGALTKLVITFHEAPVEIPSIIAKFACVCCINGRKFPQGTGKTKKDAKTAAAKSAFTELLGIHDDFVEDDNDTGKVIYDAHGRKIALNKDLDEYTAPTPGVVLEHNPVLDKEDNFAPKVALPDISAASVRPLWDLPKHPVSRFQEYCQRNEIPYSFEVSDIKGPMGFKGSVFVCDELVAEEWALNKKEAKKRAAQSAIREVMPESQWGEEDKAATQYIPAGPDPEMRGYKETAAAAAAPYQGSSPWAKPEDVAQAEAQQPKGPMEELEDYCRKVKDIDSLSIVVSDNPGPNGYEAQVMVNQAPVAYAWGQTRKDAKRNAALSGIPIIQQDYPLQSESVLDEGSHYDQMDMLSWQQLFKLLKEAEEEPSPHKSLAAFLIKRTETDKGTVVALGTGNAVNSDLCNDGRTLCDCHALVIARRSLLKYFHKEIKMFYEGNIIHSIFEEAGDCPKLKLKDHITLHLYMSQAPCGDATQFIPVDVSDMTAEDAELMEQGIHYPTFSDDNQGILRVKTNHGEMSNIVPTQEVYRPALGAIRSGQPLQTMSCSDKMLKWNVLGVQGALFSHFLCPTYVSSITLGFTYDHGHLTRAFCCRISDDILEHLGDHHYRVNHPYIGRVRRYDTEQHSAEVTPWSLNWSCGDDKLEILKAENGRSDHRSPFQSGSSGASRLCRAAFLYRFRELARDSKKMKIYQLPNYLEAKKAAVEYQNAKTAFMVNLQTNGFGGWVVNPTELSLFNK